MSLDSTASPDTVIFRDQIVPSDRDAVRRIVIETGFFTADEVDVAVELVDARLERGSASGYWFVLAEVNHRVAGYACYGPIACTVGSFDLYWIAVAPSLQGHGIGRKLVTEVESHIQNQRGRRIYIETSGRLLYKPTRKFYQGCGYDVAAVFKDFYDLGDDKWVWLKVL